MDAVTLRQLTAEKGIELSEEQLQQFEKYYELLVEWNEKMNLTGITEKQQVYEKHFYDSITPAFYYTFTGAESLIDVGSGAGFPGIPLKICFPSLKLTILDSLNKRLVFLQEVARQLGLVDISFVHSRAEDAGKDKKYRDRFDLVTARAVARMSVLAELCLPFVKPGGAFLVMKGADIEAELNEGKKAIKVLGGKTERVETFELPEEKAERNIIIIRKQQKTPSVYPRKAGTPAKKPIV
ncbi:MULTISPECIES: 16S rRNA (guanine(527)-N(7))-methyltransferase RsmG [Aneurinibacillus]|jgi:16S rRNA (guanine527-N7)-methyltransferase|uniref:Ribosomal RNA small subunit methyltransferase G n=1 Tax=Aneurinibacillus thermoaerophilus TaxID=143495 RepID=A0A1G8DDP4_ANETH|nr:MULTISPECIES: 16S rRNA (guanine(527)-N(7))-methyltransferase RsmG [Aneurinibacillus]AMA71460.1 16S rRNA (guanine(527)-N(7))-methyltransferase RsmG [Aneurinibacillus sp. XH2]MED0675365.1 16S rRNA (guanine(527)-N(7))-methyltransferase RsmG [Aneurinibacillus thermoaerophilus]MED0679124.1 16S rRNA (guanine(527)-N(7))-methyltransferase RsmG [Aneurinibacillus thermoaerophilus]MED0738426.1 16S rRNA (guanine(527)-N(7))-methyltransferase RsmG [Aneurinibacillus thermoaerophilus]MED0757446.1 16S rRNA 